ncbi:MAG TPA: YicC family protein [Candidatus Hydrogenedentes bacterium]|nr:YicC family protein [Candidatus Hydrogenedentota bacterium]HOL78139.1 YicC family protein [Candidatus Hydrogenedentota bacterium]HPO85572.1 YicC family protein [Candidatus Hydrogenedentota bacterium]
MAYSMTGFGKASCHVNGQEIVVEISSVNHRYLELSLRLPNNWLALEGDIKQVLREKISRGKLSGNIFRKRFGAPIQTIQFDVETAKHYIDASRELARLLDTNETLTLNVLMQLEGVFVPQEPEEDLETLRGPVLAAVAEAADKLNVMRAAEGKKLSLDIRERLFVIAETLKKIEQRLPEVSAEYEKRLRTRLQELKGEVDLPDDRIAVEVALLAEKSDPTEEVVRLKVHLGHMSSLLEKREPVGRRLDFLTQELQREANTLGVKTRDSGMIQDILFIKAEIEKIREQVQNIE